MEFRYKVSEYSDKIIIVGDLNVDFFKVPLTHNIHEIISTYDLVNNISVATRNRALLDPILTSTDIQSCESGVLGMEQSISDHTSLPMLLLFKCISHGSN